MRPSIEFGVRWQQARRHRRFIREAVAPIEGIAIDRAELAAILGTRDHGDQNAAYAADQEFGLSRKKSIGDLTGRSDPRDRVHGSVAAHLVAAQHGAKLLRVHDVAATVDALKVWHAVATQTLPKGKPATAVIRWPDDE